MGFLVREQLLRGLFQLFEEPPIIAGPIDCGLQFLAELREPLEALLVGEILMQCGFHS